MMDIEKTLEAIIITEKKNDKLLIIIAGLVIGVIAAALTYFGNPKNMGFRDTMRKCS